MTRNYLRALTGVLTLVALAACDSRQITGDTLDANPPSITLQPGNTNPDSANVSVPFPLHIQAGDNLSLLRVRLAFSVNGTSRIVLDTTFHAATATFKRDLDVALFGAVAGQVVRLLGIADDGSGNTTTDSLFVTVVDPEAPTVAVSAPAPGALHRAGGPLNITIAASDPSGIAKVGFELFTVGVGGVETVFMRDSVTVSTGLTDGTRSFAKVVPDTLIPQTYQLRGFAVDRTGNRAVSPQVAIIVQDVDRPTLEITAPPLDSNITVGTPVIVEVHIADNASLARLSIIGVALRGDASLGVVDTVVRFDSVFAPVNVANKASFFRAGLRDTTIRRLLNPRSVTDTIVEPVFFVARVTDASGNETVVSRRAQLVSGPVVKMIRPGQGALSAPGKSIVVELRAIDKDGVKTLGYRVASPTFNTTRSAPPTVTKRDTLSFIDTLTVPANFPVNTSFSITPFSTDNLNQPGSGSGVVVQVLSPAADAVPPLVFQTVNSRVELTDSVLVRAVDPSGIAVIGFVATDAITGALLKTDSLSVGTAFTDVQLNVQLKLPPSAAGRNIIVRSFARDANGNKGWSLPTGATTPQSVQTASKADTVLAVFGHTYHLPTGGTGADIAVDAFRRVAYVSNMTFDRLDVWQAAADAFAAKKIAVGSQPWGMMLDNSGDTLLVANSGGTNLSRVFVGSADLSQVNEIVARRIKTPNIVVFSVTFDVDTMSATYTGATYTDYSDRPQYVAQAANNEIFYSTLPTVEAPAGTIRRYDPTKPNPESQLYARYAAATAEGKVVIVNADNLAVIPKVPHPALDSLHPAFTTDEIVICDHPYGTNNPSQCVRSIFLQTVIDSLTALGSDVEALYNVDVEGIALTDTTFVAVGGDRQWIAFGEGDTPDRAGRIIMVNPLTNSLSSSVSVSDLTNNASEKLFGLAINSNSSSLAARGNQAFFADVVAPFHLRLQGKYSTTSEGAGIAYHPQNTGDTPALDDPTRTAFVASSDGSVQIVDSYHFTNRGTLAVRAPLYGPIRAVRPFVGDDPTIVVKLFGLTTEGLVVIDVRASDIKTLSGG